MHDEQNSILNDFQGGPYIPDRGGKLELAGRFTQCLSGYVFNLKGARTTHVHLDDKFIACIDVVIANHLVSYKAPFLSFSCLNEGVSQEFC